ncbi:pitrilysin family protein [Hymenobacter sp. BT770]|uniref:M16 family metallopeptidase n=1 Tax=Hymenobacter sp. BT770 TaxID=2886942 RepID=UPI001D110D08|nr:pitrilysin family protein [Hymenobacter sp. BT770]MCC3151508.1 insulinase family protein [Hymenobacter sp. BT770]MDO3413916.1 pitrilysin family protein [Hymenobacter sp. BT770]
MLDRTVAPPVQPLARVTLPAADEFPLPSGARLHVMANDAQPVVRLQAVFRAGKMAEPRFGLASLTARMLLEGTTTRTARQIADEVAFYGASLECDAGFDRSTLTLYCLTRHLPVLLPLVTDVLTNPAFPAAELEQLKTRTIQNVRVERQKTSFLASERFNELLFGADTPYGRPFDSDAYQALTVEEAQAFHRAAYSFGNVEVFLCGDVAAERELVAAAFSVPAATAAHSAADLPISTNGAAHDFTGRAATDRVAVAGSLQASVRMGRAWPAPTHPETHHLKLLVNVLGGYFGSRLMRNIREDKGLTYGIYASVGPREHGTSLVIGTDVKGESADVAVSEIELELRRLQEEAIPAEELSTVKNYILGKFANELSTVFEQCDKYKTQVFLGLPADYYTEFVRQTEAADAATLQKLAQQYLKPEDMQIVIAGPVEVVEQQE